MKLRHERICGMKYAYFINPFARDGALGRLWQRVEHHFRDALPDSEFFLPTSAQQCRDMVAEEAGAGVCIVAVGGEGTMNAVASGILASRCERETVMALVPFGNVNDYASAIGMQKDWRQALETLKTGSEVDVGVTELFTQKGSFYSLNIADTGFGATTAKRHSVDHEMSWARGLLKYNLLALRTLISWRNIPVKIQLDDEHLEGDLTLLAAGYSPTLGGFHLLPGGSPTSDHMAVTLAMNMGRLEMVRLMEKVKSGPAPESEHLLYRTARNLVVEADTALVCSVDGEVVDTEAWRVEFTAHSHRLRFRIPPVRRQSARD
jgi:diacylglycerol kinase (ATP)